MKSPKSFSKDSSQASTAKSRSAPVPVKNAAAFRRSVDFSMTARFPRKKDIIFRLVVTSEVFELQLTFCIYYLRDELGKLALWISRRPDAHRLEVQHIAASEMFQSVARYGGDGLFFLRRNCVQVGPYITEARKQTAVFHEHDIIRYERFVAYKRSNDSARILSPSFIFRQIFPDTPAGRIKTSVTHAAVENLSHVRIFFRHTQQYVLPDKPYGCGIGHVCVIHLHYPGRAAEDERESH